MSANRAQQNIPLSDSHHERLGRLDGFAVGRRHLQSRARSLTPLQALANTPEVASALDLARRWGVVLLIAVDLQFDDLLLQLRQLPGVLFPEIWKLRTDS